MAPEPPEHPPLDVDQLTGDRRLVGVTVRVVAATGSTNDDCQSLGAAAPPGLALFAEHQTAGRGRMGRRWHAPPRASLLFSLVLDLPDELARPAFLTAWSAAGVADEINERFSLGVRLKWPNDVLLAGRKLCGILVDRGARVVVGVGLNVHGRPGDWPEELRDSMTSLEHAVGGPVDRGAFAAALLDRLDRDLVDALTTGLDDLWARWRALVYPNIGDRVWARTKALEIRGELLDLHPESGLRLRGADGVVKRIAAVELERIEAE